LQQFELNHVARSGRPNENSVAETDLNWISYADPNRKPTNTISKSFAMGFHLLGTCIRARCHESSEFNTRFKSGTAVQIDHTI
jgi:hypothetical protein